MRQKRMRVTTTIQTSSILGGLPGYLEITRFFSVKADDSFSQTCATSTEAPSQITWQNLIVYCDLKIISIKKILKKIIYHNAMLKLIKYIHLLAL